MLLGAGQPRCLNGIARVRRPCFRPADQRPCYHSKPLLKPRRPPKHSKAPPPTAPDLGLPYGWKRNPFRNAYRPLQIRWRAVLVSFWAIGTAGIYTYVAVDTSLMRESVPISGRSRYTGSESQNASYATDLHKIAALERAFLSHVAACDRCKPKLEDNLLPGDDPLVMRVRGVSARLATAAGVEAESLSIRVSKQPGMRWSTCGRPPPAQRLC